MALLSGFRVQIEIFQRNTSVLQKESLKNSVKRFFNLQNVLLSEQKHFDPDAYLDDEVLKEHVECIEVIPSGSKWPVRWAS